MKDVTPKNINFFFLIFGLLLFIGGLVFVSPYIFSALRIVLGILGLLLGFYFLKRSKIF